MNARQDSGPIITKRSIFTDITVSEEFKPDIRVNFNYSLTFIHNMSSDHNFKVYGAHISWMNKVYSLKMLLLDKSTHEIAWWCFVNQY